eukprot:5139949-Pyramimonas_sp.AAC.1
MQVDASDDGAREGEEEEGDEGEWEEGMEEEEESEEPDELMRLEEEHAREHRKLLRALNRTEAARRR